jgi:hypothetical protein
MILLPFIALSSLLLSADDVSCSEKRLVPEIEVDAHQTDPTFSYNASSKDLTKRGADAYAPAGAQGPSWHKGGLTEAKTTFEQKMNYTVEKFSSGITCLYVDKIILQVTSSPSVWVANDFPPGSCMYSAVREHEMKHVHAEQAVLTTHIGRLKDALVNVSRYRTVFGPGSEQDVRQRYDDYVAQVNTVVNDEFTVYKYDEGKAQQAIDTLQEYQRISHLCPEQNK